MFKATDIDEKDTEHTHYRKVCDADSKDSMELSTPIIMAWTKNLYLLKTMNDILKKQYEKYYSDEGRKQRALNYAKKYEKALTYMKTSNNKNAELREKYNDISSDSDIDRKDVNGDSDNDSNQLIL